MKAARGYRAASSNTYKSATAALLHAQDYAMRHRRLKKRQARSLAILRVNAAARENGLTYSKLMHLLKNNEVGLDRKTLANLSQVRPDAFKAILEESGKASAAK